MGPAGQGRAGPLAHPPDALGLCGPGLWPSSGSRGSAGKAGGDGSLSGLEGAALRGRDQRHLSPLPSRDPAADSHASSWHPGFLCSRAGVLCRFLSSVPVM